MPLNVLTLSNQKSMHLKKKTAFQQGHLGAEWKPAAAQGSQGRALVKVLNVSVHDENQKEKWNVTFRFHWMETNNTSNTTEAPTQRVSPLLTRASVWTLRSHQDWIPQIH